MNLLVFSFLDIKTGIFTTPFFMAHRGQAIRATMDLVQDTTTTIGRHPADYQLCEIGQFDDQSGQLQPQAPLPLGTAASYLPTPQPTLFYREPEVGIQRGHVPPEDLEHRANGRA